MIFLIKRGDFLRLINKNNNVLYEFIIPQFICTLTSIWDLTKHNLRDLKMLKNVEGK